MKFDSGLWLVLVGGGLAAACLWVLLWAAVRSHRSGGSSLAANPVGSSDKILIRWRSLFNVVEPRLMRWSDTRWGSALLARDTVLLVRSGLHEELRAGQITAWRLCLLIGALGLGLAAAGLTTLADSLSIQARQSLPSGTVLWATVLAALLGLWWPERWLKLKRIARERALLKDLPFMLDLLTLSVESGASLAAALAHAAGKGPPGPLRDEIQRVLQEVRSGRARVQALRDLATRTDLPAISNWVAAMISAQQQGSSLGPVLRAQADQRREERFLKAEKAAMKAPVKMLFPLLVFIFPCTFLLLFFPVAVRLVQEGFLQ